MLSHTIEQGRVVSTVSRSLSFDDSFLSITCICTHTEFIIMATIDAGPWVTQALAVTIQDWKELGLGHDPETAPTGELDVLVKRVVALLLVRCAAKVAPLGTFPDLSTSNVCRSILMKRMSWPEQLDDNFVTQLTEFVKRILGGYKDVPYHNREHAYHVVISTNKLIDLMVIRQNTWSKKKPPVTFGLRNDPTALLALLFASLIHDVEHQGIPNRQLAVEDDRLAILYNDQSIAENWSIYIGFSELLQDEFQHLRTVLFPEKEEYQRFRKLVVNLVLCTDIASPERSQLVKSKWKEAFGDPVETIERKIQAENRRMSLTGQHVQFAPPQRRRGTGDSGVSDVSFERGEQGNFDDAEVSPSITPEHSASEDNGDTKLTVAVNTELNTSNHRWVSRQASMASRRSSTASRNSATSKYRQRLGILRTVDLSGETQEHYTRASMDTSSANISTVSIDLEEDQPDDLKAVVVLETLLQAADVAHNLQGWDHMVKFSSRLYNELRKSYVSKRGNDPEPRWFENQIGFLESYLLPLAHRLEDTGVFGPTVGESFALTVEDNRDRWLTEGYDVSVKTVKDGAEAYPL